MNSEPTVTELERMIVTAGLLPVNYVYNAPAPLAEGLDSLGRLQLVTSIEEAWGVDVEQELMGSTARRMTLSELAVLIDNAR